MRVMLTLIAALLGALAVWGLILILWLGFEYPYTTAAAMVTVGGGLVGAYVYEELVE